MVEFKHLDYLMPYLLSLLGFILSFILRKAAFYFFKRILFLLYQIRYSVRQEMENPVQTALNNTRNLLVDIIEKSRYRVGSRQAWLSYSKLPRTQFHFAALFCLLLHSSLSDPTLWDTL